MEHKGRFYACRDGKSLDLRLLPSQRAAAKAARMQRTVRAWNPDLGGKRQPHPIESYLTEGKISAGTAMLYGRAAYRFEASGNPNPVAWFRAQVSAKTARKTLGVLRSAVAHYMAWSGLASYEEAVQQLGPIKQGRGEKKREALTEEEVEALFDLADNLPAPLPDFLRILLATGLRVSEACALDSTDVALSGHRPRVEVVAGKGNNPRTVDLDADGIVLFRQFAKEKGPLFLWEYTQQGGLGGKGSTYTKRLQPYVVRRELQRLLDTQNAQAVTPHQLRHTRATDLLESGFDPFYIRSLLGHRSAEVLNRYLHVRPNVLKEKLKGTPRRWAAK